MFSASAKNTWNLTETGGGKGEPVTNTQSMVVNMLESNNSSIVTGISTGFETSFQTVSNVHNVLKLILRGLYYGK